MDFGKKISSLRKSRGMTQEDLGKVLNVTYQAVSKWERDESLPDIEMMSRIAKFFEVPIDYFVDGEETASASAVKTAAEPAPALIGVCTVCGKMLKEGEAHTVSPKILCHDCAERQRQGEENERLQREREVKEWKDKEIAEQCGHGFDVTLGISLALSVACFILFAVLCFRFPNGDGLYGMLMFFAPLAVFGGVQVFADFVRDLKYDEFDEDVTYTRNLSLIIAGVFSLMNIAGLLTMYFVIDDTFYIYFMIGAAILSFTFISQFMWGGIVKSFFTLGGITFKIPGFIISLDIDSILWMIITKFFLGILAAIIFLITLILSLIFSVVASIITFIPSVLRKSYKDTAVKNDD